MNHMGRIAFAVFCGLAMVSVPAVAAPSRSGPPQFRGDWHPVVGAGAVYQMESKGQPAMSLEVAVVGQEAGGYWVENRMSVPEETITKMLLTQAGPQRFIIKAAGQPAMELPVMQAQSQGMPETNLKQLINW